MLSAFTIFYFHKHDGLFILHNQVDFTKARGEVSLQQFEAAGAQIGFCSFFPMRTPFPATQGKLIQWLFDHSKETG